MSTYRPNPGDIFLVPMPGIGGPAIRIAQLIAGDGWTKYQHAGTVVGIDPFETDQGIRTVEAYPGGAIIGRLERFDLRTVIWLRCPPAYQAAVANAAVGYVGTGYSAAEYGALAMHRFHIPAPFLKERIESSGRMICSQLADRAAQDGGWHIFDDDRWPGFVTPNDLGKAAKLQPPGGYAERVKVSR